MAGLATALALSKVRCAGEGAEEGWVFGCVGRGQVPGPGRGRGEGGGGGRKELGQVDALPYLPRPHQLLFQVGIPAVVLERAAGPRTEGTSLTLWSNAFRVLDVLGLGDAVRQEAPALQGWAGWSGWAL